MSKETSKKRRYFIEDTQLYTRWVYASTKLHSNGILRMDDITPLPSKSYRAAYFQLKHYLENLEIPFPKISSVVDPSNENYFNEHIEITEEEHSEHGEDFTNQYREATNRFYKDTLTQEDIGTLSTLRPQIYEWIYLEPNIDERNILKLQKNIDGYIDDFLNNELFIFTRNYYKFEKQKELFIEKIRAMSALEVYGKNFIITSNPAAYYIGSGAREDEGFLFVHTLCALQKLGFIDVLRLWATTNPKGREGNFTYRANIVTLDGLVNEITNSFRKDNPTITFDGFDPKNSLLKFAGKEIELSKKKKKTDAVLLVETLSKEPDRYWHKDEIEEDWGYFEKDAAKNKVYYAARSINTAVRLETGIEDLIEGGTKKFRINPKYLKS